MFFFRKNALSLIPEKAIFLFIFFFRKKKVLQFIAIMLTLTMLWANSADDRLMIFFLVIPRHTIVAGYYGFTLDVRVSVHPSVRHTSICPFFVSG